VNSIKAHKIARRKTSKGSLLLEFSLILPLVLILISFAYDMGQIVMASTGLHSSVAVAARAGARVGTVGPFIANNPCSEKDWSGEGPVYQAFCNSTENLPGLQLSSFSILSPSGERCIRSNTTNDPNSYVTVSATTTVNYITPGLSAIIGIIQGKSVGIHATAVAKCEVAYDS